MQRPGRAGPPGVTGRGAGECGKGCGARDGPRRAERDGSAWRPFSARLGVGACRSRVPAMAARTRSRSEQLGARRWPGGPPGPAAVDRDAVIRRRFAPSLEPRPRYSRAARSGPALDPSRSVPGAGLAAPPGDAPRRPVMRVPRAVRALASGDRGIRGPHGARRPAPPLGRGRARPPSPSRARLCAAGDRSADSQGSPAGLVSPGAGRDCAGVIAEPALSQARPDLHGRRPRHSCVPLRRG
jgi:hypothetical protein